MNTLQQEISATKARLSAAQQRLAEAQHDIAVLTGEIRGLERALHLSSDAAPLFAGRAPGAATNVVIDAGSVDPDFGVFGGAKWSTAMKELAKRGPQFTLDDTVREAATQGIENTRKSIRSKLSEYKRDGKLIAVSAGVYRFPWAQVANGSTNK